MKKLKVSKEFVVDKNNIRWIGSRFKEHFYPLSFTVSKEMLKTKTLGKAMLDKEILDEFKPQTVSLGNVLHFLSSADKNSWYIFYVNDKKGIPWAVYALWDAGYGGWGVEAVSVEDPHRWLDGLRVVSRKFSETEPQTFKLSDPLYLETAIKIVKEAGYKVMKEL